MPELIAIPSHLQVSGNGKGLPKNRLASSLLLAQHLRKRANRAILI